MFRTVFDSFLKDIAGVLRFFSLLPLPRLTSSDDPSALPHFTRAAALIPLAGLVIALPGALFGALLSFSDLPVLVSGTVVIIGHIAITGAMHEDGLADTCDGLGAGSAPEHRLAAMHDSRIGAFGAIALILTLLIRAHCIGSLVAEGPWPVLLGVLTAAAVSRAAMVGVWYLLPPARTSGLSASIGPPSGKAALLAMLFAMGFALLTGGGRLDELETAAGIILSVLAALFIAYQAHKRLKGQTGDVLGAVQQVAETGFHIGLIL